MVNEHVIYVTPLNRNVSYVIKKLMNQKVKSFLHVLYAIISYNNFKI